MKSADHLVTRGFPGSKFSSCKSDVKHVEQSQASGKLLGEGRP